MQRHFNSVSGPPTARDVKCPHCGAMAVALIPVDSEIVVHEADADGKVRVDCRCCDGQFLVRFRIDE